MNIKLIDKPNRDIPPRAQICLNRGIPVENINKYLKNTFEDIYPPEAFGEELMRAGVRRLIQTISSNGTAYVVVDSDCDGLTSAAHLINYLYCIFPAWVENNLHWGFHEGKQHGLADQMDLLTNVRFDLVICPDSATNDIEQIKELHDGYGTEVLILDHHLSDVPFSEYAITINSQYNYPNKELSGVGVVHKFCQYIDKLLEVDYADNFLDLTSIGIMGDMMDITQLETKEMIFQGLTDDNLRNPLIEGLSRKNSFALSKADYVPSNWNNLALTPMGAAFFIIPLLNALCRSGTLEEKELVFNSMLTMKAFNEILSNKRGHKLGEMETILDQSLRACTNIKNRQTRNEDAGMELLISRAEKMLDHKVLVFPIQKGEIDPNIAGLVANKLASKYQRPVCVVTDLGDGTYAGSMRGYTKTGIDSFKDLAEQSSHCLWSRGHHNAAGICVDDPDAFTGDLDAALSNISTEIVYYVDYIFDADNIDSEIILTLAEMNDYLGTNFERPQVYIKEVNTSTIQVMKSNTLKFTTPLGTSIMMFGATDEEVEKLSMPGYKINAVCKPCKNEWNGNISPQLIIIDYELIKNDDLISSWGF